MPNLREETDDKSVLLLKNTTTIWDAAKQKDFEKIKKLLTEKPCLAHYDPNKENIVTTDASKTGLGITLWQTQFNESKEPIAFGSRFLHDTGNNYSIGELELLTVVRGIAKNRFHLYGKNVSLYTDHRALEPSKKYPKKRAIQRKIN